METVAPVFVVLETFDGGEMVHVCLNEQTANRIAAGIMQEYPDEWHHAETILCGNDGETTRWTSENVCVAIVRRTPIA